MKGLKEKYLLFKAKSFNDADAYGEIYDRYIERIYRFIYFKVSNKADAEDIASETFLKTWQHIKEGQEIKNLNAFLYSVARHLVIDHYRFRAKRLEFEENADYVVAISKTNIVEKLDISTDMEAILRALRRLKDEYNEVIIMRYLNEMPVAEIAKIINKSFNNTRVLIHRSLNALKKAIGESRDL